LLSRSLSFQDVYNFLDGSLDQGTPAAASSPGTVKALMKYSRYLSGREDLAAGSNNITGIMNGVIKEKLKIIPKDLE
jgi:serine carboxypeptidase 1